MDSEQAKIILSAYRPLRDDAREDALLAEALAALENDPVVAAWYADQNAMDAAMRAAVASIEAPKNLKESILASSKTVAFPKRPAFWAKPVWLAAAALVILGLVVGAFLPRDHRLTFAALEDVVPKLTDQHQHPFGAKARDIDKVRTWFANQGAPSQFSMPAGLRNASGMGCEVVSMQGAKVSLLCFEVGSVHAHLYVVDRSEISHAPTPGAEPQMQQVGKYAIVSWTEGNLTYILAARGDVESVRRLL